MRLWCLARFCSTHAYYRNKNHTLLDSNMNKIWYACSWGSLGGNYFSDFTLSWGGGGGGGANKKQLVFISWNIENEVAKHCKRFPVFVHKTKVRTLNLRHGSLQINIIYEIAKLKSFLRNRGRPNFKVKVGAFSLYGGHWELPASGVLGRGYVHPLSVGGRITPFISPPTTTPVSGIYLPSPCTHLFSLAQTSLICE